MTRHDPDFPTRYRKLPVTVEAIRYTPGTNCTAVAEFLGDSPDDLTCAEEADHEQTEYAIATLEGVMHASPGDYIIRGVHGEHYPCKPDIFEATYERADTVIPGQNPGKPTAEAVADALLRYETGGCCGFGTTCGLCDCGKADETPEQTQTRDAMELDRARAALAAVPEAQNPAQQPSGCLPGPLDEAQRNDHDQHTPQRCAPSEDGLANVLRDILVRVFEQDKDIVAQDAARAVLALFGDQPTVAQAKAEEALLLTGHEDKGRGFDQLLVRQLADPEVRASYVAAQLRRIKAEALREMADDIAAVVKRIRDAHGGAPSNVVEHILGGYGKAEGVIRDRADAIESGAEQ